MDIAVKVVISPYDAAETYAEQKEAARIKRGDIVEILKPMQLALVPDENGDYQITLDPDKRGCGYIFVKNIPENISWQKIKNKIKRALFEGSTLIRHTVWTIPVSLVPVAMRNKLLTNGYANVEWAAAKSYIRKKIIANKLNASLDDINTTLIDADVT